MIVNFYNSGHNCRMPVNMQWNDGKGERHTFDSRFLTFRTGFMALMMAAARHGLELCMADDNPVPPKENEEEKAHEMVAAATDKAINHSVTAPVATATLLHTVLTHPHCEASCRGNYSIWPRQPQPHSALETSGCLSFQL